MEKKYIKITFGIFMKNVSISSKGDNLTTAIISKVNNTKKKYFLSLLTLILHVLNKILVNIRKKKLKPNGLLTKRKYQKW